MASGGRRLRRKLGSRCGRTTTRRALSCKWRGAPLAATRTSIALVDFEGEGSGLLPSASASLPAMSAAVAASTLAASVLDAVRRAGEPLPVLIDRQHVAVAARSEHYARSPATPRRIGSPLCPSFGRLPTAHGSGSMASIHGIAIERWPYWAVRTATAASSGRLRHGVPRTWRKRSRRRGRWGMRSAHRSSGGHIPKAGPLPTCRSWRRASVKGLHGPWDRAVPPRGSGCST